MTDWGRLEFGEPLFLLLGLLLPLFWWRSRGGAWPLALWRSLVFLALVLALAAPERVRERERGAGKGEARIFAIDLSHSSPQSLRRWAEEVIETHFQPTAEDRVVVFAGEVRETRDWKRRLRGEISAEGLRPERTNLEKLLSYLAANRGAAERAFLFTDGWETEGEAERAVSELARAGVRLFPIVPRGPMAAPNVAVSKLIVPHHAVSGDGVNVKVILENHNQQTVEGTLTVRRNGEIVRNEFVALRPGSQIFTYPEGVGKQALTSFQALFTPRTAKADLYAADNQATSWIAVQVKEKALLLNGQRGEGRYLEEILRRRGLEVHSQTVEGEPPALAGYGLVIFNNVERERFPASYLAAVERHVAAGSAFVMLGGEPSFGPGGYRRTPIEAILPVELKEPKKEEKNRGFVLVIDKSGSMREENRIVYAKEAAKAVASQLRDQDLLGVVAFDSSPFVVVPLSTVARIRGSFASDVDRLKPGGRTFLLPAIVEAKRQLARQGVERKHVIILSDGETGGAQGEYVDLVTVMRQELKINVSAIAIGDQANVPLLKRIAQYGGGFFHHTYDPRTLPQLVSQQIQDRAEPEPPRAEREYLPIPMRGSEILASFPERSYPPVRGFVETEIRKGARLDLAVAKDERRFPLLASWAYGKGKSVALTTDLHGGWSAAWVRWPALEKFWGSILDWLLPPREKIPPHEVRLNLVDGRPVMDLYLYQEPNGPPAFRYSFSGRGGRGEGVLRRVAAGHYRGEMPFSEPGDYRIALVEGSRAKREQGRYPELVYTLGFPPRAEMPSSRVDLALLSKLARATGGEINPEMSEAAPRVEVTRSAAPLRNALILAAALLFVSELLARRFVFQAAR